VNSSTTTVIIVVIMLTPLGTKEDDETKTSSDYYPTHYTPQQHHHYYYHSIPFNDDSNHHHHPQQQQQHSQTSTLYDTTQYYNISPVYSHSQTNARSHDDDTIHPTSSVYMPVYHHPHHYTSEELSLPSKPIDHPPTPMYDYNLSPVSSMPTSQVFHSHTGYIQAHVEQTHCTTSITAGDYLSSYVRRSTWMTNSNL
jgi:hypothetical protein